MQMMQTNMLMRRGINFLCSRTSSFNAANPNYKLPYVSSYFLNFYTSKSESSSDNRNPSYSKTDTENPVDVEDVSRADLKSQIEKFYEGDYQAIPDIFESILIRKLAGKHEESDDELMNEFRKEHTSKVGDEELDSDLDLDSGSESYLYSDSDSESDSKSDE